MNYETFTKINEFYCLMISYSQQQQKSDQNKWSNLKEDFNPCVPYNFPMDDSFIPSILITICWTTGQLPLSVRLSVVFLGLVIWNE